MTKHSNQRPRMATQLAALPWRRNGDGVEVLLITSRVNKKWLLPKGWPIEGKDEPHSAAQEAFEEAGIIGSIRSAPIGSYRYIKEINEDNRRPARALVYSLVVERILDEWPEQDQRERKWFTLLEASKAVFEPDLSRFLSDLARNWQSLH